MVRSVLAVFQFLRSVSAKAETQKEDEVPLQKRPFEVLRKAYYIEVVQRWRALPHAYVIAVVVLSCRKAQR